jgi:molybdate transport system substrate-binding protein
MRVTLRAVARGLAGAALLAPAFVPSGSVDASAAMHVVRVYAAASLSDAFTELGRALERSKPGYVVKFNFAGSQQLAAQLAQGAGADVFASADERWMADAAQHGLLAGEATTFARNRLVVIVPATNPARIGKLQDLARSGVKLVLGADAVPVGRYSRVMLRNLARDPAFDPEFATRVLRNVVSEEENVKSVVGKVQLGEADAGIVYRSDVAPAVARFVRVLKVPENANVIAAYPIAALRGAREPEAARVFVDLALSADGQGILSKHGLIPVGPARP